MSKHEEIQQLNEKLTDLDEQYSRLAQQAEATAQKRDKLNTKFNEIRNEASNLKAERNELNDEVKALKQRRNELKSRILQKIEEAKALRPQIIAVHNKKPDASMAQLKKQIEEIDWKIQTSSLSQEQEKQCVSIVKELETQLNVYRKLEKLKQQNLKLQTEINALKTNEKNEHEKLTVNAKKSQELHQRMIAKVEESEKVKAEADTMHQTFLEMGKKVKGIEDEITVLCIQLKELKGAAREEIRKEKSVSVSALREKLEKEAREKLQRGEKLTLEEFQLLADKDETQD